MHNFDRVHNYRIAGNFREAEMFAIFVIKRQLAKICSRENFFLQKFIVDEMRTPSTGHVEVSLKWGFEPRVTLGGTLNEQNLE